MLQRRIFEDLCVVLSNGSIIDGEHLSIVHYTVPINFISLVGGGGLKNFDQKLKF